MYPQSTVSATDKLKQQRVSKERAHKIIVDDTDHTPLNISANWILFPTEIDKLRHSKTLTQWNVNHQQLALYSVGLFHDSWFPQTMGSEMGIWRQHQFYIHHQIAHPPAFVRARQRNVLWGSQIQRVQRWKHKCSSVLSLAREKMWIAVEDEMMRGKSKRGKKPQGQNKQQQKIWEASTTFHVAPKQRRINCDWT